MLSLCQRGDMNCTISNAIQCVQGQYSDGTSIHLDETKGGQHNSPVINLMKVITFNIFE